MSLSWNPNLSSFEVKQTMVSNHVPATVIPGPVLVYEAWDRQVQSVEGQWPDKDLKALRGGVSACWGILILDDSLKLDSQTKLPEFLPRLRTACLSIGLQLPQEAPSVLQKDSSIIGNRQKIVEAIEVIKKTSPNMDLLLAVLPNSDHRAITAIKHWGDVLVGVTTSIICSDVQLSLSETDSFHRYALGLNAQLGGVSRGLKSPQFSWDTSGIVIMGAAIHRPHPAVTSAAMVSVVSSLDLQCTRYMASTDIQEPAPRSIQNFEALVKRNMVNWKARVGAQIGQKPYPPTSVIIFRSGVLESDGNGVAQKEVRGLKHFFGDVKASEAPKVTYILVETKHDFKMEPTSFLGPRAVSGTVVDRRLVEPATQWPGFYLKSDRDGTLLPTRYSVVWDENEFPLLKVQAITYALCHAIPASLEAVRKPAPLYYAELAAARLGYQFQPPWSVEPSAEPQEYDHEYYTEGFKTVHPALIGKMYWL